MVALFKQRGTTGPQQCPGRVHDWLQRKLMLELEQRGACRISVSHNLQRGSCDPAQTWAVNETLQQPVGWWRVLKVPGNKRINWT